MTATPYPGSSCRPARQSAWPATPPVLLAQGQTLTNASHAQVATPSPSISPPSSSTLNLSKPSGALQLDSWSSTCVPCCTSDLPSSCCSCGPKGLCTSPARAARFLWLFQISFHLSKNPECGENPPFTSQKSDALIDKLWRLVGKRRSSNRACGGASLHSGQKGGQFQGDNP